MKDSPTPKDPLYDSQLALVASLRRQTERDFAKVPPSWQPILRSELMRRENKGRKVGTNRHWIGSWVALARVIGDQEPATLTAATWEKIVYDWLTNTMRKGNKPLSRNTVAGYCIDIKQGLKRFYADGRVPEQIKEAMQVSLPSHKPKGRLVTMEDFYALLDHVSSKEAYSPRQVAEVVALLWCLWDSWMRVNEMLGLNLGDVKLDEDKGMLVMREGRVLQKRGARSVPIVDAVGPLKVWMALHPGAGNPDAPLFCNLRCKTGLSRISDSRVDQLLKRWGERSGLHDQKDRDKKLSAHDFRHSGNTRAARNRWEPALRARKSGWTPTSKMIGHYTHLDDKDVHDQMLRDAGIDLMGFRQQVAAGNLETALGELVAKLLQQRQAIPVVPILKPGFPALKVLPPERAVQA